MVSPQGLLALEGELTPILVQMVKSANMNGLLDSDSDSLTDCQQKVKARLHEIMQKDQEFIEDDFQKVEVEARFNLSKVFCIKYLVRIHKQFNTSMFVMLRFHSICPY